VFVFISDVELDTRSSETELRLAVVELTVVAATVNDPVDVVE
jgi:hypothetical protein